MRAEETPAIRELRDAPGRKGRISGGSSKRTGCWGEFEVQSPAHGFRPPPTLAVRGRQKKVRGARGSTFIETFADREIVLAANEGNPPIVRAVATLEGRLQIDLLCLFSFPCKVNDPAPIIHGRRKLPSAYSLA
jgi:hypothetical protein